MHRWALWVCVFSRTVGCGGGHGPAGGGDAGAGERDGSGETDAGSVGPCAAGERVIEAAGPAGWGYAVVEEGEVVAMRAGGVACISDPDVPITTTTLFRTTIMSELLTSIAALEAEASGELDLGSTVRSVLGSLAIEPAEWADAITLRDLVNQTSGLPSGIANGEGIAGCTTTGGTTLEGAVASLSTMQMSHPPGGLQARGILSLVVLARALEESDPAGRSFAEIVQARVTEPMGLPSMHVGTRADVDYACSHELTPTALRERLGTACEAHQPHDLAHGSLEDLARLSQILANDGVAPEGGRVLAESTVDAIFEGTDLGSWATSAHRATVTPMHLWPSEAAGTIAATSYGDGGNEIFVAISRERRFAAVAILNTRVAAGTPTPLGAIESCFTERLGLEEGGLDGAYRPRAQWMPDAAATSAIAGTYRSAPGDGSVELTWSGERLEGMLTAPETGSTRGWFEPRLPDRFNGHSVGSTRQWPTRVYRDSSGNPYAISIWGIEHVLFRDPPGPPVP